jgi:hypothetical protein
MRTFTDNAGRVWSVAINVATLKRVKTLLGIDLFGQVGQSLQGLGDLIADPCRLCDVLFVLCQEEAKAREVTDEDFGRALGGDVLENAADAFLEELTDFFPNPGRRASLRKAIAAGKKIGERLLARSQAEIEGLDVERIADQIEQEIRSKSGVMSWRESSG